MGIWEATLAGTHTLIDFWHCRECSRDEWESLLESVVEAAGVQLLELRIKEFQPQGLTAFCLLSESHLSVHTWPENDYVGIDLFTCGMHCQPERAIEILTEFLRPQSSQIQTLQRGCKPSVNPLVGSTQDG